LTQDVTLSTLARNQDLFRGSIQTIDKQTITKALLWLRGEAFYPFPTSIHLNLTLRCTARCVHCKQWTWPNHSEFNISQLEQLFQTFKSWGVQTITFGGGNPLLHDNIVLALQMAYQANMQVGIISEGITMSDELANAICQYARWIRFSLDGPNPDIHDTIRNTPGLFYRVMACIQSLKSRQSQLRIGLNCVLQKRNLNSLSQMIDLAEYIGLDVLLFKIPHGEDYGNRFLPTAQEWEQFVEWARTAAERDSQVKTNLSELCDLLGMVFCTQDVAQGKPVQSFYAHKQVHCFAPLFFLTCNSEGNMYPCDYLQADVRLWGSRYADMRNEFCLGNVLEDSQQVLDNLAILLRNRVHGLPASSYDECGSCTRFCQLNAALTKLDRELRTSPINEQVITEHLVQTEAQRIGGSFL
jgi:MoaA/NifB/PqqE/SkfB family radical SAM enzyme